jgi:hypothetical protein
MDAFKDNETAYPTKDFFVWHHRLTGSCEMGRREFARQHNIDIENGKMTVKEFVRLTRNAYGGDTIQMLEQRINIRE